MKDLTKRTITGAIYVLSVIAAVCIDRYVAAVYFGIIMILALREFISVSAKAEVSLNAPMIYFVSVVAYLALLSHAFGFAYSAIAMFVSLLCIIALAISALYVKSATPFSSMAYSLTAVGYIVLPLSLSNLLFAMHDYFDCNVLLSIFIFAWCNDTFAYLVGCKFGKRRLFERHSPKKSWEGFFGGFAATVLAGVVMWQLLGGNVYIWLLMAVVTTVVGTFGDLIESMFKRQMGVKDSGNILPGHGGILDRFDILLLVLPAMWIVLSVVQFLSTRFPGLLN
mgnify:FL=1